jgi:hypothetical protein
VLITVTSGYSYNEHIALQKKRPVSLPDHRAKPLIGRDKKAIVLRCNEVS